MRSPVLPFGYDWLDGKLVIDPKEYRVVQKILQLWRKGLAVLQMGPRTALACIRLGNASVIAKKEGNGAPQENLKYST